MIALVGALFAAACLIGASPVSADITIEPAPPPASETSSQTQFGLMRRFEAFYRAYATRDIPSLQPFFISPLWERLDRIGLARLFAVSALIAERHLIVFAPPLDRAPRIATVLTTLVVRENRALLVCHVTEWKWIRPVVGAPEDWHIVFEKFPEKTGACKDQFKPDEPRT